MSKLNKCRYAEQCNIYQGKTETKDEQLVIYKNVFCHRGERGWVNCKQYLSQSNQKTNDHS